MLARAGIFRARGTYATRALYASALFSLHFGLFCVILYPDRIISAPFRAGMMPAREAFGTAGAAGVFSWQ